MNTCVAPNATTATIDEVRHVFGEEMISIHEHPALDHYLVRPRMVLDPEQYDLARDLLTEAAVAQGRLSEAALGEHCRRWLSAPNKNESDPPVAAGPAPPLHRPPLAP